MTSKQTLSINDTIIYLELKEKLLRTCNRKPFYQNGKSKVQRLRYKWNTISMKQINKYVPGIITSFFIQIQGISY